MATAYTHPGAVPAMPAVARILSRYDRPRLAAFIAIAIDLLDTLDGPEDAEDGDPDEEDDPPGQCDEDGINTGSDVHQVQWHQFGPGCVISDSDYDDFV